MASILGDTKYYEPAPRAWHGAASIDNRLYLWGGQTEDFSESSRRKLASVVEAYDPYLEMWEQRATTGVPPPGLYSGGCTSLNETLLWYGGNDGKSWFGSLHQLNTVTLNWDELHHNSQSQGPMAKSGCGLVSFQVNKLGLFGGYGLPTGPTQPGSAFIRNNCYSDGRGWTNEFHLFHLQEGVWSSPPTTGSRPPPCSHFSFTAIDSHRAVLFGGYSREHGYMNDVYIFNIQTMHCSKLDTPAGDPWPVGRSSHAVCCLNYGEEHPQLMVSGGRDKDGNTLKDLWVLDVEAGTWKELMLPEGTQPRRGHTITPFNLSPGVVEATVFGGSPKLIPGEDDQQQPKIAETTVVRLESIEISASGSESPNREWVVMGVAKDRQLGSPERIREKMQEKAALVSSELASKRENVRKAENKITELEEKVESAETRVRVALARAMTAEIRCDRIPDLEQQLQSTQHLLHAKVEEIKALTTQLSHNQEQFSTQQQALSHLQYNAQQKEEQLQAKACENAALQAHNQVLANQVAQLEQRIQATQAALADTQKQIPQLEQQLLSKEAQIQSLTEAHHKPTHWQPTITNRPKKASISTQTDSTSVQPTQQTGAVSLYSAELQVQHAELQQKVTGSTELLLSANWEIQGKNEQLRSLQADKQDLEYQLEIKSIENQEQKEELGTLKVDKQRIGEQIKALEIEKRKLQDELTKETILETSLAYEVDLFREDVMDKEEELSQKTEQIQQLLHTSSTEAVLDTHPPSANSLSSFLTGADVIAHRDFAITNTPQSYHWEEYGFRLHVPEGSLEAGLSETTVSVQVSLSGHFKFPADSKLVSAVYWISGPCKFSQPLTVDIQHCITPSQCSSLSFVHTTCENLPYQFKQLEGGVFSQQSIYGSASVSHFSGFGIIDTVKHWWCEEYRAYLYRQKKSNFHYHLHFIVAKALKACQTVIEEELCRSGSLQTEKDLSFPLKFDDHISLKIGKGGMVIENGWKLTPCYEPTIQKSRIDLFSGGQLPECELVLRCLKTDKPAGFEQEIQLQGAADHTYFNLCIEGTDIVSGSDGLFSSDSPPCDESTCTSSPLPPTPTHKDLMNEVAVKIPTKWRFVGIELGLQPDQLNAIEVEQNGILALCFSAVFHKWECETSPPYSWSTIIAALEAPQVSAKHLAKALKGRL